MIACGDDVEIVFDQDEGVSGVCKPVEVLLKLPNVFAVESDGGLVEEIERLAPPLFSELFTEADALGLASG